MNRAVARKLQEIVDRATDLEQYGDATAWSARARSYLETTLGSEARAQFDSLTVMDETRWWESVALRRGYLEGLIALAEPDLMDDGGPIPKSKRLQSRRVFVVHGHDDAAKTSVALFLQRVGLDPIILHEQPSGGRTIIEKFEVYSDEIAFAVVLLTPDDIGSEVSDPKKHLSSGAGCLAA